jgi:hypothetical protein
MIWYITRRSPASWKKSIDNWDIKVYKWHMDTLVQLYFSPLCFQLHPIVISYSHIEKYHSRVLYAWIKVHSHASHTPLSCAFSGICHVSQASMCNLRRMSHVLNSLKIPIYGNFLGALRHPCSLCWLCHRSRHQLCTMCRVSHTRCLVHLYPCIQYTHKKQRELKPRWWNVICAIRWVVSLGKSCTLPDEIEQTWVPLKARKVCEGYSTSKGILNHATTAMDILEKTFLINNMF